MSAALLPGGGLLTPVTDAAAASAGADEQLNHAQMNKQFARLDKMAGAFSERLEQLEAVAGAQLHTPTDIAAAASTGDATMVAADAAAVASSVSSSSSASTAAGVAPLLLSSYHHLLELKTLSRALTHLSETSKAQLAARKKRLDRVNLAHESILYEQAHFQREIAIARDFRSKHAANPLQLVSEEEFRAGTGSGGSGAPPELLPSQLSSAHELHLARLHDELSRRKRLLDALAAAQERNRAQQEANDALAARDARFLAHMKAAEEANKQLAAELWPNDAELFNDAVAANAPMNEEA
jgi:hypothetical protein